MTMWGMPVLLIRLHEEANANSLHKLERGTPGLLQASKYVGSTHIFHISTAR